MGKEDQEQEKSEQITHKSQDGKATALLWTHAYTMEIGGSDY